jgi:diguanylate cyclase (GGDEF)-like protein
MIWPHPLRRGFKWIRTSRARTVLAQARNGPNEAQRAAKRACYSALHDGLTLLPNGKYFRARLEQALGHTEPPHQALAVLYLNLNDFTLFIDTYGHDAGDELLKIVAARMLLAMRAEDMLSRLRNDEFACLVAGLPTRSQLSDLVHGLLRAVSAPLKIGILYLCVHPNIGIARCPADGVSAEALLANAEFAMRLAKQHKTGFAFVDER